MRAWTLGFPPGYEAAVRMPGNAKMPGGYAFRTHEEAVKYVVNNPLDAGRFQPYEMEIPGDDFDAVTEQHATKPCRVLLVSAPFINPDTGLPV